MRIGIVGIGNMGRALGVRWARGFNTASAEVIWLDRQRLESTGVSVFLRGDDPQAKLLARGLVEELGSIAQGVPGATRAVANAGRSGRCTS